MCARASPRAEKREVSAVRGGGATRDQVKANVTNVEAHIAEYAQIISDLRTEIHSLKLALVRRRRRRCRRARS